MRVAECKKNGENWGVVYREMTAEEETEIQMADTLTVSPYADRVEQLIRERYSISDELAILRQRDVKPEEFEAYYAFAEECKAKAKETVKDHA